VPIQILIIFFTFQSCQEKLDR